MSNAKRDALKVVKVLEEFRNPDSLDGLARFGINTRNTLGIPIPVLRDLAGEIGHSHTLALELWKTQIHEARILAAYIDNPDEVTANQMETWAKDFDSWDVCDQVCSGLFDRTSLAASKAVKWAGRKEEFVKRAGFVLMAALSVHDKESGDELFRSFLPFIMKASTDERNFVRKAVNWALRQIGKRNMRLNKAAIAAAIEIGKAESKTARWIAADAIRELMGSAVQSRLKKARA